MKEFNLPASWLPSFYLQTKNRPRIESFNIIPKTNQDTNARITVDSIFVDLPHWFHWKHRAQHYVWVRIKSLWIRQLK